MGAKMADKGQSLAPHGADRGGTGGQPRPRDLSHGAVPVQRSVAGMQAGPCCRLAVGHTILVIVYYLLTRQTVYQELGAHDVAERHRRAVERRLAPGELRATPILWETTCAGAPELGLAHLLHFPRSPAIGLAV